jgi:Domain of unknown function (DUF4145)
VEDEAVSPERVYCNYCRRKTLHRILYTATEIRTEELEGYTNDYTTTFETLQCCGCFEAVLRRTVTDDIPFDDPDVRYFPPPTSRHPPTWEHLIPNDLRSVMEEIYRSLDADNRRLPMMGARTLVDMLIVEKVGDVGTFGEKLKQLEAKGFISSQNREVLDAVLDISSAAIHRGHAATTEEVNAVMDIVENLLNATYVLPGMAQKLKISTQPRPARKQTASS